MTDYESRSEKNYKEIQKFLASSEESCPMVLYTGEIRRLPKLFPVLIERTGEPEIVPGLYKCIMTRKPEN